MIQKDINFSEDLTHVNYKTITGTEFLKLAKTKHGYTYYERTGLGSAVIVFGENKQITSTSFMPDEESYRHASICGFDINFESLREKIKDRIHQCGTNNL